MTENLKKSPLFDAHQSADATFGQCDDWCVPLSYAGPIAEAKMVVDRAGVIDLSHLGRIRVRGDQMLDLMELACTHDVAHQEDDTICDSLMLDANGRILADCKVVRLEDEWLVLCEPCNREKILEQLQTLGEVMEVKVVDRTDKTAHIAVIGTQAAEILKSALPEDPTAIPAGGVKVNSLLVTKYIAIRENLGNIWGLHVIIPKMLAGKAWRFITQKAEDNCVEPLGTGGFDILLMEQGIARYGCELNLTVDPVTAGLENLVDSNYDFSGKQAYEKIAQSPSGRKRVGLILETQSPADIPTMGMSVFRDDGLEVGTVTSATFSAQLEKVIAQAYVTKETFTDKPALTVELPNQSDPIKATIVELPFVKNV